MDKCNKCLKNGNIEKVQICAVPGSKYFNFNSELHLCKDCYEDFLREFGNTELINKSDKQTNEKLLMLYLKNLPNEGQERVFNHYAYGPFVSFKRKQEWIRENKVKATPSEAGAEETLHKRTKPKGKRCPPLKADVCAEAFWTDFSGTLKLCCPINGIYNEEICVKCQYYSDGKRQKKSVLSEAQSNLYCSMRKNDLENKLKAASKFHSKPNRKAKKPSSQTNREKIGSLEFVNQRKRGIDK